jgi:hypothetical protein
MKVVKIVVGLVVLIALVIAGGAYYALNNVNGFVEKIIEETGSDLTKTSVAVGGVDIKVLEGRGAIYNLSIANPEGYSSNSLFSAKSIALALNIESLTKPVKVIDSISVGEISLLAEQKNVKDTNVQALLDNMQSSGGAKEENTSSSSANDVRIAIKKITFAATVIDLQTEKLGGKKITLPAFSLKNIGDASTGVTPEEAGQKITQQLMAKVKAAVKTELSALLKNEVKAKAKEKIKEKLKENLSTDKLKSLFK